MTAEPCRTETSANISQTGLCINYEVCPPSVIFRDRQLVSGGVQAKRPLLRHSQMPKERIMACLKLLSHSSQRDREQECPAFPPPTDRKVLIQANLTLILKHVSSLLPSLLQWVCVLKLSFGPVPPCLVVALLLRLCDLLLPW